MNFNEYVESKTPLMKSLGDLFNLDLDHGNSHIKLANIDIHQPKVDYSDCLVRQVPYCYNIDLYLEYDKGPNTGKKLKYTIEVPKMCEHGFLIADAEGQKIKFRSPIVIGEINQKINYRGQKSKKNRTIHFNPIFSIYLDKTPDGYPSCIVINNKDKGEPIARYPLVGYLRHYGIEESELKKYFTSLDSPELTEGEYVLIGVPETEIDYYNDKILQLTKVDPKLTKEDPYLKAETLFRLIKIAFDYPLTFEPFTPFDVKFLDFATLLFDIDIRSQGYVKSKFARMIQKNQNIGVSLTKMIYKSFAMQTDSGSIQTATNSNALSFLSQSRKIYFKNYKRKEKKQAIYTGDFYGLICPSKTPESVQLTSIKNEVASDASFDDNQKMKITVYTKDLLTNSKSKPTELPYREYYRARVLAVDNFDYRINKVIPIKGKIKIFQFGEFKDIPYESEKDFDYIRIPDGALSLNAGLIPMANRCDGTRMSMATNMLDQAIPVLGARNSIVKTSISKLIYDKSNFNIRTPIDGTVVRVVDNYITIQTPDKKYRTFTVPESINSTAHTSNRLMPAVVPGDTVKKNDVIFVSDSFKNKELALTVPLRVGYYAYGFKTEEDAIVISESASKLLSHNITKMIRIDINSNKVALFGKQEITQKLMEMGKIDSYKGRIARLNDFGLPIPGEEYSRIKRECIALYQSYNYDPSKASGRIMDLIRNNKKKENLRMYRVDREDLPSEFSEGTVNRVRVFYKNTALVKERYAKLIEYYNKEHQDYVDHVTGGLDTKLPELELKLDPKGNIDLSILITITCNKPAEIGSKITNRYASKGTIGDVLPDDQMPRINDEDGLPLQIMIPPQSTINRKNISQIYEMNLCLACKIAFDRNEKNIKNRDYKDARAVLNTLYVTDRFNNYSEKDIEDFHKTFDEYYSVEVNAIDMVYNQKVMSEICKFFNIDQDGCYLYDPVEQGRITIQKVTVGITEIMRLDKLPEFKSKATADVYDAENTVLYGGSSRQGGQKIGK